MHLAHIISLLPVRLWTCICAWYYELFWDLLFCLSIHLAAVCIELDVCLK